MLKEKQQEIDMLKKERDLERERMTKAAIQADNAEQSKIALNQEYYQVNICFHIKYVINNTLSKYIFLTCCLVSRVHRKNSSGSTISFSEIVRRKKNLECTIGRRKEKM